MVKKEELEDYENDAFYFLIQSDEEALAHLKEHPEIDVNLQNSGGNSLLYRSAGRQRLQTTQYLIEKGANVNLANDYGDIPIYSLVVNEDYSDETIREATLKLLLDNGSDLISKESGDGHYKPMSILESAVTKPRPRIVKILLEAGASPHEKVGKNRTPLIAALMQFTRQSTEYRKEEMEILKLLAHYSKNLPEFVREMGEFCHDNRNNNFDAMPKLDSILKTLKTAPEELNRYAKRKLDAEAVAAEARAWEVKKEEAETRRRQNSLDKQYAAAIILEEAANASTFPVYDNKQEFVTSTCYKQDVAAASALPSPVLEFPSKKSSPSLFSFIFNKVNNKVSDLFNREKHVVENQSGNDYVKLAEDMEDEVIVTNKEKGNIEDTIPLLSSSSSQSSSHWQNYELRRRNTVAMASNRSRPSTPPVPVR